MLAGSWMVRPPLMVRDCQVMKMAGLVARKTGGSETPCLRQQGRGRQGTG